jgi:multidrug transporter EmrE-like cation transporter
MIYLVLAIITTSIGQFNYKLYINQKKKYILFITILFFVITPILSYQALKELSIDFVYTTTAINIVIVMILSKYFLKEHLSLRKIIGAFTIILGIIIYNLT